MRILVTGGAGFIGSSLVRRLVLQEGAEVLTLDALTYAATRTTLAAVDGHPRHRFVQGDIGDAKLVAELFAQFQPDLVMNLAAETHVDRSVDGPAAFINTNIVGTGVLLDAALSYWKGLSDTARQAFRFHQISTDEVYGSLGPTGHFTETTAYAPRSPYAASKAGADHLVRAYFTTYGLPTLVTNCSNNYGPYQFPEKLIPLMILKAISGEPLPVYGKGDNVRDWLHVADHVDALITVAAKAKPGTTYLVGGGTELANLEIVKRLCALLDTRRPRADGKKHESAIAFVTDRPGHDFRYSIDPAQIIADFGWKPAHDFDSGLAATVDWYLDNEDWWAPIYKGYKGQRLGLSKSA